jgi:hypothetical protein
MNAEIASGSSHCLAGSLAGASASAFFFNKRGARPMPRNAKPKDEGQVLPDQTKTNGINAQQLKDFIASIEAEQEQIDEIMRNAQVACQPHVDQIKAIKKEAAENGIPKKPLSAKLRERGLRKKADSCRETLSEEQRETYDEISQKLDDLFSYADRQEAA